MPDSWQPNQKHFDLAVSLGLNPQHQLQRFRDHANRTQRRLKNWNTAFTNWLRKGAELAQQQAVSGGGRQQRGGSRVQTGLSVAEDLRRMEEGDEGE